MGTSRFKIVILTIIILLVFVVLFQNRKTVILSFLFWNMEVSVIILVAALFAIGFTSGWLAGRLPRRASNRSQWRRSLNVRKEAGIRDLGHNSLL